MRKLRLDPDALTVDTFATAPEDALRGTVRGHESERICGPIDEKETQPATCLGCGTGATACGGATCVWTCGASCGCQVSGGATCGLTYCVDTCDVCYSRVSDYPEIC